VWGQSVGGFSSVSPGSACQRSGDGGIVAIEPSNQFRERLPIQDLDPKLRPAGCAPPMGMIGTQMELPEGMPALEPAQPAAASISAGSKAQAGERQGETQPQVQQDALLDGHPTYPQNRGIALGIVGLSCAGFREIGSAGFSGRGDGTRVSRPPSSDDGDIHPGEERPGNRVISFRAGEQWKRAIGFCIAYSSLRSFFR